MASFAKTFHVISLSAFVIVVSACVGTPSSDKTPEPLHIEGDSTIPNLKTLEKEVASSVGEDSFDPEFIGVIVEPPNFSEDYNIDTPIAFRALGKGWGKTENEARQNALSNAKAFLAQKLYSDVSIRAAGRNSAMTRAIEMTCRVQLQNCSVCAQETRYWEASKSFYCYIGIEVKRADVENAKAKVIVSAPVEEEVLIPGYTFEYCSPDFPAEIRGGKNRYSHGESASFSVVPQEDLYLGIFWINDDGLSDLVCENRKNPFRFVQSGIPWTSDFEFYVEKRFSKKENGRLVFVLMKRNFDFISLDALDENEPVSAEIIGDWLAQLPASERFIYALPFTIERR